MKEKVIIVCGDVIKLKYKEEDAEKVEANWEKIAMQLLAVGAKIYEEERERAKNILNQINESVIETTREMHNIFDAPIKSAFDSVNEILEHLDDWLEEHRDIIFKDNELPRPIYNNSVNNILRRDVRYKNKNIRLNLLHCVRM
jgi:hypothetical protein